MYLEYLKIFLLFISIPLLATSKKQFIVSAGSYGGNYYKTGYYISKIMNQFDYHYRFSVIESNGSNENIENLKSRLADFTIVQRNILLKNLYNESKGIKNVEIILPLFQEKLIIYVHDSIAISLDEFRKRIKSSDIKTIGITSKNGFSYNLFLTISKLLHIHLPNNIFITDNYVNLINSFSKNNIDAIITFSLPIVEVERLKNAKKVYFNEEEAELLQNRINNINKIQFNTKRQNSYTIGSWTFLIGLNKSVVEIEKNGKSIVGYLTQSILKNNDVIPQMINNSLELYKKSKHKYVNLMNGIPINQNLISYLGYQNNTYVKYLKIFIIFLLIVIPIIYLNKKLFNNISLYFLWIRYRHILIGISIVIGLYFLSIEFLVQAEADFFKQLGLKSKLLDLTKKDLHFWLIIRNLTGNDGGIFPLSSFGKIMVSFSSYIIWFGTLFIGLSEYIVYRINKKRIKGVSKVKYKNHIVIVGWNDTTNKLIIEALTAIKSYNKSNERIVCIVKSTSQIISRYKVIAELHANKKLDLIQGEAREEQVLELANIHLAKTVVLLAEDSSISADEKTLLRALEISRYCRKKMLTQKIVKRSKDFLSYDVDKYIDSIYIIAEINDDKYKKDLFNSDVNEIVSTSNYANNILTQSMLNHGVSKVLDEVLEYNEYNEFYEIDLLKKENHHLRYRTFDELLIALRKVKILLIAIKVVYRDESGNEIIDFPSVKKLLKQDGLRKQVIVNPYTETEIKRKVDEDDQLIVFARSGKELKAQIKRVEFD